MTKGITFISVCGYKSLAKKVTIDVRPLTILAGANSSGKSSIMQPLLMMKQTLDESYDPGDLKINGPHVKFTLVDQLLTKVLDNKLSEKYKIGIEIDQNEQIIETFKKREKKSIEITEMIYKNKEKDIIYMLAPGMTQEQILNINPNITRRFGKLKHGKIEYDTLKIERDRCFLDLTLNSTRRTSSGRTPLVDTGPFINSIQGIIHVPALRGNPRRNYDVAAVGSTFPGTFENYISSIINNWQVNGDLRINDLSRSLEMLGLTWKVSARPVNDTNVEILVGRLPHNVNRIEADGEADLVNISDVGFGISQTLPVLVALLAAEPNQLVYIEQPEIHLHPRAQVAMAQILANAAKRGVQVVVETHSSFLLKGIQTLVAEGSLSPDIVKLHWFQRGEDGITEVRSADLDKAGAFGDWPEDFADIEIESEKSYLDAATSQLEMV